MKKLLSFLPCCLLGLFFSCSEKGPDPIVDPEEPQSIVSCEIISPGEETIELSAGGFTIKGDASVNKGTIADVVLSVGGSVVEDVSAVPFEYAYVFATGQSEGELEIILTVRGDSEEAPVKSDTVCVTIVNTSVNIPQEVEVSLALPGGAEWVSDVPLVIKGSASVNVGGISSVTLTVGGNIISDVSEVPFEYSYAAPAELPEGNVEISLEVVGDAGASDVETLFVLHKKPEKEDDDKGNEDLTMTDSRDGKSYRIVTIGSQTWMAENLAYLPEVSPAATAGEDATNIKRYYVLNYDGSDVAAAKNTEEYGLYGVLYNWYAANDTVEGTGASADAVPSGVHGICPSGWHLPSKAEWKQLENCVSAELPDVIGQNQSYETDSTMKNVWAALCALEVWGESMMTEENPDLENGPRDLYGFSVVPAGKCWQTGTFGYSDTDTGFWATDMQTYGGGCVEFTNSRYFLQYTKSGYNPKRGYSVRCVKD